MSQPVVRCWEVRATGAAIERWLAQVDARVMPRYREASGFRRVRILVPRGGSPRSVVGLTGRDAMAAVERYSRPTPGGAVMPDRVAGLMPDHDGHATHCDAMLVEDDG